MIKLSIILLFGVISTCYGLSCWECSNAKTNEECLANGRLHKCVEERAICEDQIRHEQFGRQILIEKRCKQEHACTNNVNQNVKKAWPIQCNIKSPTSVCRCCCKEDGCNKDLMTCWNKLPQYDMQKKDGCHHRPNPPQHGNMQCYGNMEIGTYCDFECHDGFIAIGSKRVTCLDNYTWDFPPPKCDRIKCPPKPEKPGNGSVHCSDDIFLHSVCKYLCHPDYKLIGSSATQCVDVGRGDGTGDWSRPKPYCKPLFCPVLGKIRHGSVSCTRGRKVNSKCTFSCDKDYVAFPKGLTDNTCLNTARWSRGLPCCQLPCPPYAVMDFIVVMDSSSSVGDENYKKMKNFVRSFLSDFQVRADSAHYAIIRYNKVVDTATEILLNDYPDNLDAILRAFDEIPYDGSGTRTGNALNYTADVLLKVGNRKIAKDVVLLITDGASQDDVSIPAKKIRDSGALFFILPVKPPVGRLDMSEIEVMAGPGNDDKILRDALEGGFDALDEAFAKRMSFLLCGDPCRPNPIHHHEDL